MIFSPLSLPNKIETKRFRKQQQEQQQLKNIKQMSFKLYIYNAGLEAAILDREYFYMSVHQYKQ